MPSLLELDTSHCDCTVEYATEEITGRATKCYYHGQGVWQCPECTKIYDHSDVVYQVLITYSKTFDEDGEIEEFFEIEIETEDERLHNAPNSKYPDSTNLKSLKDDLYDAISSEEIKIKEGKFKTEIYWNWYRSSYEYEEYDLDMFIISEEKITDGGS